MRIGTMLSDVLRSIFSPPATREYPSVRKDAPERLRGKLTWDRSKCTGCSLCAKECPANAIEMILIDRASKRFVMRYHMDACTFCAQCVQNCRFNCIEMSNKEWELAALNKEAFTVHYGSDEDVAKILETFGKNQAEGSLEAKPNA
jgi:NAD(P)H-quinone oxidoreductase subunit I